MPSLETIIRELDARDSRLEKYVVEYTVERVQHSAENESLNRVNAPKVEQGELSSKALIDSPHDDDTEFMKLRLEVFQPKLRYTLWLDPKNESAFEFGIFNDGIVTNFDESRLVGGRRLVSREKAIWFPTLETVAGYRDRSLQTYLRKLGKGVIATVTIEPLEATEDAPSMVCINCSKSLGEFGGVSEEAVVRIVLDPSRQFWPRLIEEGTRYVCSGEKKDFVTLRTGVEAYFQSGDVNIPKQVTTQIQRFIWPDNLVPGQIPTPSSVHVAHTQTFTLIDFQLIEEVDPTRWEFQFPPGTRYQDLDNETYVVNPGGVAEKLAAKLNRPVLPVSKYSAQQAGEILRQHQASEQTIVRSSTVGWLFYVNLGLIVLCVLLFILYRRKY